MSRIFLIPGLGADTRIYNNIDLDCHEVVPINWIEPALTETLTSYAQKLIYQFDITSGSIVIGNSLGGMLAVEIAKKVKLKKVILISSIKTSDEAPGYFSFFRVVPVHRMIPGKLIGQLGPLIRIVFGKMNEADNWLFRDMLKNTPPVFVQWAMQAILKWDNHIIPKNIKHITGDKDLIFNYKNMTDVTIIKNGTHIMIFDKAKEINKLLNNILKRLN